MMIPDPAPYVWRAPPVRRPVAFVRRETIARRREAMLDEALMETFPASDPVSVAHIT